MFCHIEALSSTGVGPKDHDLSVEDVMAGGVGRALKAIEVKLGNVETRLKRLYEALEALYPHALVETQAGSS